MDFILLKPVDCGLRIVNCVSSSIVSTRAGEDDGGDVVGEEHQR